ncbi:Hsp20/alpha crystallin family protein [Pedobacter sp.]|uniref:Hsp20/alpha crystallin family protein n=1 Tax=Pedobacter sp. TaxID=1411316 RepID=UPI003D7F5DD7
MSLIKFNNGTKDNNLTKGFNDIFDSMFQDSFMSDRLMSKVPAVNISETVDHYHIEMAAPGLNKDDFKIKLDRNLLTVSVEQQKQNVETNKQYSKREFSYSSFVRSFALPDTADDSGIEATYKDGILNIAVAKKEEAKQVVRQIEIK